MTQHHVKEWNWKWKIDDWSKEKIKHVMGIHSVFTKKIYNVLIMNETMISFKFC